MFLIIGLGNPGKRYQHTRHNVGFMVVEALGLMVHGSWTMDKRLHAEILRATIGKERLILAKPQTFMNNSGQSVRAIMSTVKCQMSTVIIVHDDIDLAFGTIRVSHNASSAGHRGVQSMMEHLGTKEFWRVRVGINPGSSVETTEFVLQRFTKVEQKALPAIIDKSVDLLQRMIDGELKAQTIHCLP